MLAVACSAEVTNGAGKFRTDALAVKVPKRAWQKLSAGAGAKAHRFYDWAVIDLAEPRPDRPGRTPTRQSPPADPLQPRSQAQALLACDLFGPAL